MHDQGTLAVYVRTHIPGNESLTEDALTLLWYQLVDEGSADAMFYDGGVRCVGDFVAFMQAPDVFCYVVYASGANVGAAVENTVGDTVKMPGNAGTPLALAWLNNFSGKAAMMHFSLFKSALSRKEALGRFVLGFLLHARVGDAYCLDALYGMTPKPYAHVLRYIRRIGFQVQGTIPGAVRMIPNSYKEGRGDSVTYVDGVISVCTRENLAG